MRVHQRGLIRGDIEQEGIELVHIAQEAAPSGAILAPALLCRKLLFFMVPPLRIDLSYRIPA